MENSKASKSQLDFWRKAGDQYIPEIEEIPPADGKKTRSYFSDLRTYLISGKKTGESLPIEVQPIQMVLCQKEDNLATDYPVFFDSENDDLIPLYQMLVQLVNEHFDQESSASIHHKLPKIVANVQKTIQEGENEKVVQHLIDEIIIACQLLDLPQNDTIDLEAIIDTIRKTLLNQVKILFGYNRKTVFHILNLQNNRRGDLKSEFLKTIKEVITGLNELLILQGDVSNLPNIQMDFAEDLISFEKITDVSISSVSSQLPKSSLNRLRSALQTLTTAQKSYAQGKMTIIVSKQLVESFDLESIFDDVHIQVVSENTCLHANIQSKKDIDEFVKTVAALRVGKLMIEQKYDEALHDHYFDQFSLAYLTKGDLKYLHPLIVIENSRQLMLQSNDFLISLSKNSFVKILGLNLLDDLFDSYYKDENDYLELASLAIFRRYSYIYQGDIERASVLNESYRKGFDFPGPVFWNILIPSGARQDKTEEYLALHAAVESRYFPRIEYEANENHFAGNPINLQNNPSPDAYFVTYEQKVKSLSGIESKDFGFTIAEFFAMDSKLQKTLEIMPPIYQSTSLIPLTEYLSQPKDSLSDKIPFIWLSDDQNKLRQAVIPVYWIQKCRERLEYWNYLQSISGINKSHWQENINAMKSEWDAVKNTEIEVLRSTLHEKYKKERSGHLKEAVTRMLYGLLNQGNKVEGLLTEISRENIQPEVEVNQAVTSLANQEMEQEKKVTRDMIKEEAWIESDECTSCKDCVDALPSVFKYNENKQAYVYNPKGGTFAQIVKIAEKCPARCIHPGVPQNKNEASIEKWIKRAEKFN